MYNDNNNNNVTRFGLPVSGPLSFRKYKKGANVERAHTVAWETCSPQTLRNLTDHFED